MTTAREIITRAYQLNGVLTKSEALSGDEASDGLKSLNAMLSSWTNDSLLAFARLSESFPLVSGQASYTIGSGGDFDTTRPTQILSAFTRIGETDYQIQVIPDVDFDTITQKDISNSIPDVLYYDGNAPLGTITIYPVPTTGTLHIRTEKPLSEFASLDSELDLPPGWERALVYNLSIEDAATYGQPIPNSTYEIAMDALGKIRTAVARNKTMDAFSYSGSNNNIYSGWYT